MPEAQVEALAWQYGLSWGGRFGDPMHFEAMGRQAWQSKQRQLAAMGIAPTPGGRNLATGSGGAMMPQGAQLTQGDFGQQLAFHLQTLTQNLTRYFGGPGGERGSQQQLLTQIQALNNTVQQTSARQSSVIRDVERGLTEEQARNQVARERAERG